MPQLSDDYIVRISTAGRSMRLSKGMRTVDPLVRLAVSTQKKIRSPDARSRRSLFRRGSRANCVGGW